MTQNLEPESGAAGAAREGRPARRQSIGDFKEQIILAGGGQLHTLSNVWPGTFGHAMNTLAAEGYLDWTLVRGVTPMENGWAYTLTEKGEAFRKALLTA